MSPKNFNEIKYREQNKRINKVKECFKDLPKYQEDMQLKLANSKDDTEIFYYPCPNFTERDLESISMEDVIRIINGHLEYLEVVRPEKLILGEAIRFVRHNDDIGGRCISIVYKHIPYESSLKRTYHRLSNNLVVFLTSLSLLIAIFIPPLYNILDKYSMGFSMLLFIACSVFVFRSFFKILELIFEILEQWKFED